MGSLKLGDLNGLDVILAIMEALCSETGDCKYRSHPLLKKMGKVVNLDRKLEAVSINIQRITEKEDKEIWRLCSYLLEGKISE